MALVLFLTLAAMPQQEQLLEPRASEQLAQCLLAETTLAKNVRGLGFKGDVEGPVIATVGVIPDTSPEVAVAAALFVANSRATLLLANIDGDVLTPEVGSAWILRSAKGQWSVVDGHGGVGTYAAIGRFVTHLTHDYRPSRIRLTSRAAACHQWTPTGAGRER